MQYFEGHSDTLGLFADGDFLRTAAAAVAAPFRPADVHKVAGIEARGFVLASCVALQQAQASSRFGKRAPSIPGQRSS
jgi:adenine/guanine phosphoribosyltransferase-like PRPP-binding protein